MSIRKPKCLTLHEKSLVIQGLNEGQCATYLAKQYGVAKSTICKIKQNKELICEAVKDTYMGLAKRQTLKTSVFPRMEKKLYEWFLEQRNQNVILNGDMIKQTAKQIHLQIKENDKQFTASDGWLERFKKRFGIRLSKRHSKVENIKNPMTKSPELQHTLIAPEVPTLYTNFNFDLRFIYL